MRDLIQRDPREAYEEDNTPPPASGCASQTTVGQVAHQFEELVCRCCGEPAMTCDCDGYRTANLVAPGSYDAREERANRAAGRVVRPVDAPPYEDG